MQFVIAIEASHQRGMGHLFRGMHLAEGLTARGDDVLIVINRDERSEEILRKGHMRTEIIDSYGKGLHWEHNIIRSIKPDWWINDRLDTEMDHSMRIINAGIQLATFDDHGSGACKARCNVLAMDLMPMEKASNGLYGPDYMIMDPLIEKYRLRIVERDSMNVLVTLGGSDTYGVTPRVLAAMMNVPGNFAINVAIGPNFVHDDELIRALEENRKNVTVHRSVPDLLALMSDSDLIVCGGGITLFEAACLGIPAVTIANEPHEVPITEWFENKGYGLYAGFHGEQFEPRISSLLTALLNDKKMRMAMSKKGMGLVDGQGLLRILRMLTRVGHG